MTEKVDYTVSVRLMTYNHGRYIRQAMDSVMMQKTDFFVEVVIGDDFSTDITREILREYKSSENIHIRILPREKGDAYWVKRQQLGRLYNFVNILENCNGRYIALLDGDDYWVDPLKLQKQVAFLESNPSFVLCAGNSRVYHEDDPDTVEYIRPHFSNCELDVFTVEDQITFEAPYQTSTVLFRNTTLDFPPNFFGFPSGDINLFILLMRHGKAKYFDSIFSIYRDHAGGVTKVNSSNLELKHRKKIAMYKHMDEYLSHQYTHLYNRHIRSSFKKLILVYSHSGHFFKSFKCLLEFYSYSEDSYEFLKILYSNIKVTIKSFTHRNKTRNFDKNHIFRR